MNETNIEGLDGVSETLSTVTTGVVEETRTMLHLDELANYFTWGNLMKMITSVIAILIFYILYRIIKRLIAKAAAKKAQPGTVKTITKAVSYVFYVLITMYVLSLFGINLTAVWGAAGVAGVAIGFAAQTSVSNLISGLFVIVERAMKSGDFIEVAGVSGTVDSVGLLSVTVNTLDNQAIRIPNSTIINSNLINYSRHEKRRFVFDLPISYNSDMDTALKAANEIADTLIKDGVVFSDPAPVAFYDGFGSAVNLKLAVWFDRTQLIKTKNAVYTTTVKVFNKYGVVIPFTRYDISLVPSDGKDAAGKKIPALEKDDAKTVSKTRRRSVKSADVKS